MESGVRIIPNDRDSNQSRPGRRYGTEGDSDRMRSFKLSVGSARYRSRFRVTHSCPRFLAFDRHDNRAPE